MSPAPGNAPSIIPVELWLKPSAPRDPGKTTYSLQLTQRLKGIRFSIDEWMVELFGPDKPEPMPFNWMVERVARCHRQIGRMASRCAQADLAPILDLGFLRARHRADFAAIASQTGSGIALHVFDMPADQRWNRVRARNETRGEPFSLHVSRPMFNFIERIWEPPTPTEMQAYNGIDATR